MISKSTEILPKVLSVSVHPDYETLGWAGTISIHVTDGLQVY